MRTHDGVLLTSMQHVRIALLFMVDDGAFFRTNI